MATVISKKSSSAFRVSDAHTLTPHGEHAKFCVENSVYAVYLTGKNHTLKCDDGREFSVSKSRWNQTKEIQEGDLLFMGDTVNKKVYKGKVLKRYTPYKVRDSHWSVRREVNKRMKGKSLHEVAVEEEVEFLFKVDWKEVEDVGGIWEKLATSRRITAFPLY